MAVYLFGNISKRERQSLVKAGQLPSVDLGGLFLDIKKVYQKGENLLLLGDTLRDIKEMLLQFDTGRKKKPMVLVSGFCGKVWGEVKQTLEAEGLTFTDVQWIVGVAKDIEETKHFYVETYKGQLISVSGSKEAEEVVPYLDRLVTVSEGQCWSIVPIRRKEKGGKSYV